MLCHSNGKSFVSMLRFVRSQKSLIVLNWNSVGEYKWITTHSMRSIQNMEQVQRKKVIKREKESKTNVEEAKE